MTAKSASDGEPTGNDASIADRLARFVDEWRVRTRTPSLSERLRRFLAEAEPLLRARARPPIRPSKLLDSSALAKTLADLHQPLQQARSAGASVNPWAAAGLKRNEVRNAAALATLWSPASGGDTAVAFLAAWFDRLRPQDGSLPDRAALDRGYVIRTEHCPIDAASERVDLTVEGEGFLIGVEIKIGAGLQPKQLERYQGSIGRRADSRGARSAVVFLSPFAPPVVAGVTWSRWTDVAAAARASLPRGGDQRHFNHRLIEQFAAHVARFRGARG